METIKETKNLFLLGGMAILLGIIHNILFFNEGMGINFTILVLLSLAAGWYIDQKSGKKLQKQSVIIIILTLFFASMVFVRSSELLTVFNILGTLLLMLILVDLQIGKKLKEYLPGDFIKVAFLPFQFLPTLGGTMSEFFALRKLGNHNPKTREIIRGTVMAVAALAIFTILFASADLVFRKLVDQLFSFSFEPDFVPRLIVFIIVSAFFIGAFGYLSKKASQNTASNAEKKPRSLGALETTILLVSINILFVIFIGLQLTYLFGGNAHIIAQGLTYAEYARKGFYELIVVAILSFLIISFAERQVVKKEDSHLKSFKVLSTLLIVQVIAILVSAYARLSLYEQAYGFSTIRLYSYALMIWIAVVLILLALHIITHGSRAKFALRVFASVVILLVSMNLINPDAFIAKRNIERYKVTGKVDTAYLASLSYDAIPYTVTLLSDTNETTKNQFARDLYWSLNRGGDFDNRSYSDLDNASWKSSTLMRPRARELLKPFRALIETNKDIRFVSVNANF